MNDELKNLIENANEDVTTFDFDGREVPCIIFDEEKYDSLLSKVAGKPLSINTDLNILQDGMGHVFVEVFLTFSHNGMVEKVIINAKKHLFFFKSLAKTSMLAIASPKSRYGNDKVFMIQLPQPVRAESALELIERGLVQSKPK